MLLSVIEESRKNVMHILLSMVLLLHTTISFMQTFAEANRRQWQCVETEWEKEKEKLLNSLLGTTHDILELPTEAEVLDTW